MKMWKVPYVYLNQQFKNPKKYYNVIDSLIKTGDFTLGKTLNEFEINAAKKLGVKHAIGVSSGTDALILSLRVLGIGPGDEVITAPNSFVASAASIALVGARPVFVDVRDDYTMDPSLLERVITKRTRAVIPVHLTGWPADMKPIASIAHNHSLYIVEDAAQAFLTQYDGRCMGTFGTMGIFSFHPLKILNVWGDGGMIITNNDGFANKLRQWRNHGLKNREEVEFFGMNSRLHTIQAALGNEMLSEVETTIRKRNETASLYDSQLAKLEPYVHIPNRRLQGVSVRSVYATYVIQVQQREKLQAFLQKKGIETVIQYPIPIHLQKAARYLGYKRGDFPVCEHQADTILTLPCHQYLTKKDVLYVCKSIGEFCKK